MSTLIVGYARTPFVRFNGVFKDVPAPTLGAHAVAAALAAAGITPEGVEYVVAGQVLQAAVGQNPARQTAVAAGIPMSTPAITLNAVCLSGMEAVVAGHRMIDAGEADVVVAVGQESMSLAPHVLVGSRQGTKYGPAALIDTLEFDGLTDAFERRSMGLSTDEFNTSLSLGREEQDVFAASSHSRLAASRVLVREEIAPFTVPGRTTVTVTDDDGLRAETTPESLGRLRAAFREGGTVTAGNSSQITDGAAAVVLVSSDYAAANGLTGHARIVSHAFVSGPDVSLHAQPANAINAALARSFYGVTDLAAVEINEAFAAVVVHSTLRLGVNPTIVNGHGGAIALGHPIGASGARIVGLLARRLADLGPGSIGGAGICGGGGQGSAVVLEAI
ncbi:acetyl-CoA C-acyltransferase [Glaciihabitans sp. UYNi722]|uniref:acetyl-CoA C-acyltransferase n=1 Tax=Glaciihabitans sp. UYNi722 TaxID=3156344 RepID=UPI003396C610